MTFDWITFDLYGTLVDWDLGLRQFFKRLLVKRRVMIPPDEMAKAWKQAHAKALKGRYRHYREIVYESLENALSESKITYDVDDGRDLALALGSWRPFAEAKACLPRLQRMAKIGIVANADLEFVNRSVIHLDIAPNLVMTAEDVRAYKPSPRVFIRALSRMYAPPGRCLHVASDPALDFPPARLIGIRTCVLRRSSTPRAVKPEPDLDVPSLEALARRLETGIPVRGARG